MPFNQIILYSIIRGFQLGLLALGVTMIFAILRFANFAHGEAVYPKKGSNYWNILFCSVHSGAWLIKTKDCS